jgi:twitching motility protein PilI
VLTGVVDLAGFLGLRERIPAAVREQARVVAFNPALELNAALLIDKLAGLRHADQMTPVAPDDQPQPAFAGGRWLDASGRLWQELRLSMLPRDEHFLRIIGVE